MDSTEPAADLPNASQHQTPKHFFRPTSPVSVLRYTNVVNISVGVVIVQNGRYCMVEEHGIEGKAVWNFPSGKANLHEDILDAAVREVRQETGISISITGCISIYYYCTKANSYDQKCDRLTVRFNFWAEPTGDVGSMSPGNDKTHISWFNKPEIEEILSQKTYRNWITARLIEDSLKETIYPLDILLIKP